MSLRTNANLVAINQSQYHELAVSVVLDRLLELQTAQREVQLIALTYDVLCPAISLASKAWLVNDSTVDCACTAAEIQYALTMPSVNWARFAIKVRTEVVIQLVGV